MASNHTEADQNDANELGVEPEQLWQAADRLRGSIDQIASIAIGTDQARAKDVLGRVYEYFLAIRGIEANLGEQPADSIIRDLHPDLKADYILANPPFSVFDCSGPLLRDDVRWKFGTPSVGNANCVWIQHFIHHLAPANGRGGGIPGFCKSAALHDIDKHGYVLTPGRCVGVVEVEDDGEPFVEEMQHLTAELEESFAESDALQARIRASLEGLDYG